MLSMLSKTTFPSNNLVCFRVIKVILNLSFFFCYNKFEVNVFICFYPEKKLKCKYFKLMLKLFFYQFLSIRDFRAKTFSFLLSELNLLFQIRICNSVLESVRLINSFSCPYQEERLQRLQERLDVPYDETSLDHQVLLFFLKLSFYVLYLVCPLYSLNLHSENGSSGILLSCYIHTNFY